MRTTKIILLLAASLTLSSCITYNKPPLIFVTKTSIGLDAGVSAVEQGGGLYFYKRFEGIIDPLEGHKAQSVLAKLNFGTSSGDNVGQWIAAGDAATILAGNQTVAIALTGKDIQLATSFQQGINLKHLVLYADIQNKLMKYPKMKNISTEIDTVSKSIFDKLFNESKLNPDNNKEFAKTFSALVAEYNNCNNKKENCKLKDNVSVTELSKEIDDKLNALLAIMIGQLTNILTKEQKLWIQ